MHWLIWLSVGIVLGILELFNPGIFLVGVGVSMAIAAIPAALSMALWASFWFSLSPLCFSSFS